ncbi:urease accessory protein UreE [Salinigranum marinum]|uniref:urease accessory protein UreE n=1 Tax=Salinigranum marinum TaxID=1515595 RepID=UPI002989B461|nr:urease accessory protein UreE [Salinigranum marinum]
MLVARGPVEPEAGGDADSAVDGGVVVDDTQRRRSRFRTRTTTGEEVGVVVEDAPVLAPGDLLRTDDGRHLVVELEPTEALVVELPAGATPARMVAGGHAIGNKHWDLVVRDGRVYVPAAGEADHRRAFLESWLPAAAEVRVEPVEPTTFDGSHHNDHSHGHGDGSTHSHAHGDGHNHTHDHAGLTVDGVRRAAGGGDDDE